MSTNSEQDALLEAIFASPDDDAPRLVYADWLDEHGEPEQAAFIRIQIERHNTADPEVNKKLEKRETEAWKKLKKKWADLFTVPGQFGQQDFVRGFVFGSVQGWRQISVKQYIARSANWWPRLATREVWLKCDGPCPDAFFDCPHLRSLRKLLINNGNHSNTRGMEILPEEFVIKVFSCNKFDRLENLSIGRVPLSRPVVDAMLRSPYLPRLNALYVGYFISRGGGKVHRGVLRFSTPHLRRTPGTAASVLARELPELEEYMVIVPRGETSCAAIARHTQQLRD